MELQIKLWQPQVICKSLAILRIKQKKNILGIKLVMPLTRTI